MAPLSPLDHAITLGIYFVILVISAVLVFWLTNTLMRRLTRGTNAVEEIARKGNLAVALVYATFFGVIAIVVWRPISPLMASWARMLYSGISIRDFSLFILRALVYISSALLLSSAAIFGSVAAFTKLTEEVDEWAEIRKGNIAIAVQLSILALTIGYFVSDFVAYLMIFLGSRLAAL